MAGVILIILIVGIIFGALYVYILHIIDKKMKEKSTGKHDVIKSNDINSFQNNSAIKCDVCGKEIKKEESYKGCCKECASEIKNRIQNPRKSVLIECKTCHQKISSNATTCPHCGEPVSFTEEEIKQAEENNNYELIFYVIGIVILIILFFSIAVLNGGVIPLFTVEIEGEGTITSSSDY